MTRKLVPSVNAGSMADIAFLLLIFFLVTTTIETDYGINRKLPPLLEDTPEVTIRERNLFRVEVNQFDELLVEDSRMDIKDLKKATIAFLDNGGGSGDLICNYCKGKNDLKSSDNPNKAVISLINNRETSYATYIVVQNELVAAYNELRDREAMKLYGASFLEMERDFKDVHYGGDKKVLRSRINNVQSMYPEKISEAEPVHQ